MFLKKFLWKTANLSCTFNKGNYTLEELCLYSWGKRKNNCHPIIILGHYSCDLNLAMPFEMLLFWLAWYLTLVGIVSKWKENLGKIVEIIWNTYSVISKNHGLFIIVCWSQPAALHWDIDVFFFWKEDLHER